MKMTRVIPFGAAVVIALSALPALAGGDAAKGKNIYAQKCKACHSLKAGDHKMGPSLAGVFGKKAGTTSYKRYRGLKGSTLIWNEKNLDGFLKNPIKFIGKKSRMKSRLKGAQNRADVIDYMKTLK